MIQCNCRLWVVSTFIDRLPRLNLEWSPELQDRWFSACERLMGLLDACAAQPTKEDR